MYDDVLDFLAPRELRERRQVLHVGVHAAGRDQPHEVEGSPTAHGRACRTQSRVLEERALLDRIVDADELLVLDVSRAHREVPDLAVSHDAVRKADVAAARAEGRVRIRLCERAQTRRLRAGHGVRGRIRGKAPPVEHAEDDRSIRRLRCVAQANARTTAANSSGSSDAPPTSAPSIPSASANSRTERALTLPP